MKNGTIQNDAEHAKALLRIEQLMDAEPGSQEALELDVLVTAVEAYEDLRFPVRDSDAPQTQPGTN
jgi:HTH-type transcriptional regulator/antitoxin HigA